MRLIAHQWNNRASLKRNRQVSFAFQEDIVGGVLVDGGAFVDGIGRVMGSVQRLSEVEIFVAIAAASQPMVVQVVGDDPVGKELIEPASAGMRVLALGEPLASTASKPAVPLAGSATNCRMACSPYCSKK